MSHPALDAFGDLQEAARDPHVAGCAQCQTELATQQQIHDLLTSLPDPGPVPPEVIARIETTLSNLAGESHVSPESSTVPSTDSVQSTTTPAEPVVTAETVVPLSSAPSARRRRPLMAAAAAAVVLVGGGFVVSQLVPSNSTQDSGAAGAAMQDKSAQGLAGAADSVRAVSSGTDYKRGELDAQVSQQLKASSTESAATGLLSTPQGLAGCLSALGAPSTTPVLVDVATFEGKPAAILVLPGESGSQEIWVVSPTCKPGADGTKYYTTSR